MHREVLVHVKEEQCDICSVVCSSEAMAVAHYHGIKHRKVRLTSCSFSLLLLQSPAPSVSCSFTLLLLHSPAPYQPPQKVTKMLESLGGSGSGPQHNLRALTSACYSSGPSVPGFSQFRCELCKVGSYLYLLLLLLQPPPPPGRLHRPHPCHHALCWSQTPEEAGRGQQVAGSDLFVCLIVCVKTRSVHDVWGGGGAGGQDIWDRDSSPSGDSC